MLIRKKRLVGLKIIFSCKQHKRSFSSYGLPKKIGESLLIFCLGEIRYGKDQKFISSFDSRLNKLLFFFQNH